MATQKDRSMNREVKSRDKTRGLFGKYINSMLLGTCVPIFALLEEVEPKIPKVPDYDGYLGLHIGNFQPVLRRTWHMNSKSIQCLPHQQRLVQILILELVYINSSQNNKILEFTTGQNSHYQWTREIKISFNTVTNLHRVPQPWPFYSLRVLASTNHKTIWNGLVNCHSIVCDVNVSKRSSRWRRLCSPVAGTPWRVDAWRRPPDWHQWSRE